MNTFTVTFAVLLAFTGSLSAAAEAPAPSTAFVGCIPVAERGDNKFGCFITASEELGKLPATPQYWHIYEYPTRAAAEAAKGKHGTVVESYGKVWLYSIEGSAWNANGGKRVARIGPLPVKEAGSYTAGYMEATFTEGMKSRVHRHPGPEAWYVLAGEQCLETPGHAQFLRAGESGIVPEGPPMMLASVGTAERRSLVLILHDSTRPMTILENIDWKPAGLCAAGKH